MAEYQERRIWEAEFRGRPAGKHMGYHVYVAAESLPEALSALTKLPPDEDVELKGLELVTWCRGIII